MAPLDCSQCFYNSAKRLRLSTDNEMDYEEGAVLQGFQSVDSPTSVFSAEDSNFETDDEEDEDISVPSTTSTISSTPKRFTCTTNRLNTVRKCLFPFDNSDDSQCEEELEEEEKDRDNCQNL